MKTQKLIFLTTLIACSGIVYAQEYAFKVLANKGKNEIKAGTAWEPLKTGATLSSGDELKLGDNAYIGLVHSSGKPVEVKQAGVYKVSDLETRVPAGSSVLNKYTDFILSSNSSESKNRLAATGAVRRDVAVAGPIRLFLPDEDHTGVFNNSAVIRWDGSKVEGPYVVSIKNMFEDELLKIETNETNYQIDMSASRFARESAILIEVSSKADPKMISKRHMIKRLSPAEIEKVTTALAEIRQSVAEETALNKVFMAGFYENHNLLIDAIYAYEEAEKLEPEAYRETYEEFLLRHNLK